MLQEKSPIKSKDAKIETKDQMGKLQGPSTKFPKKSTQNMKSCLVKTMSDTRKLNSSKVINPIGNRIEMEVVHERVSKTKREIEQLKAELQKLIDDGRSKPNTGEIKRNIMLGNVEGENNSTSAIHINKAKTIKRNVSEATKNITFTRKNESSDIHLNRAKTLKDNINDIMAPPEAVSLIINIPSSHKTQSSAKVLEVQEDTKKVRNYDQEAAREYIKKQKERRKAEMKNQKQEGTLTKDIKKQRLEELRQKSLHLVSKNVQHKREKSKSRENLDRRIVPKATVEKDVVIDSQINRLELKDENDLSKPLQTSEQPLPAMEISLNLLQKQHQAAIKIQACFRGFLQRKSYKQNVPLKRMLKEQATKEVQTVEVKKNIPIWLQAPTALPYPYNFINAVKRKLHLTVKQITDTNDVAVQSSLSNHSINESQQIGIENSNFNRHSEKIDEIAKSPTNNTNLKSFLSHKCLDVKGLEPLVLTRNKKSSVSSNLKTEANRIESDSDTSKNIPEISSESGVAVINQQQSHKRSHSTDTDYDDKTRINFSRIKKLKLIKPKKLNFCESLKSNSKMSELISEHITESHDSNDKIKNGIFINNESSRKDSIISYNKCNYSQSSGIAKTASTNFTTKRSDTKTASISIKTQPYPELVPPAETLQSFRDYMKDLAMEGPKPASLEESSLLEVLETEKPSNSIVEPGDYSSNFTSLVSSIKPSMPSLKRPSISLHSRVSSENKQEGDCDDKFVTNIILRQGERTAVESRLKSNEIHLKFEAELHLLNEFNDSLRQVMAVEKSLLDLAHKANTENIKGVTFETRDTQTSVLTKSSSDAKIPSEPLSGGQNQKDSSIQSQIPSINYSRGSEVTEPMDIFGLDSTVVETNHSSLVTTGLELSQIKDCLTSSIEESNNLNVSVLSKENLYNANVQTGLSLDMFEQLIKDEDARIENLKTILKIREKSLVDRTKGELAWLEIQKKHLRDSGQLQEISAIKKKQRGLLIKLEHERHEMQRLKQMQKAASKERKLVLKEQRNMIKAQLSNTSMITKIKRSMREEHRQSGPLKVYNIKSRSESIRSETSLSRKSSTAEEVISVVSRTQSVISHISEEAPILNNNELTKKDSAADSVSPNIHIKTEHVKRSLLMREAALQKRRKAAEELLQWHQRLVEEEGKITELELAASAIINQAPVISSSMASDKAAGGKHKFKGSQLNLLWYNMTGREDKKFNDNTNYSMSAISLERFCKDAKKYAKDFNKKGGKILSDASDSSTIKSEVNNITSAMELSKIHSKNEKILNAKHSSDKVSQSLLQASISNLITKASQGTDYSSDFESPTMADKLTGYNKTITETSKNTHSKSERQSSIEERNSRELETNNEIVVPNSIAGGDLEISHQQLTSQDVETDEFSNYSDDAITAATINESTNKEIINLEVIKLNTEIIKPLGLDGIDSRASGDEDIVFTFESKICDVEDDHQSNQFSNIGEDVASEANEEMPLEINEQIVLSNETSCDQLNTSFEKTDYSSNKKDTKLVSQLNLFEDSEKVFSEIDDNENELLTENKSNVLTEISEQDKDEILKSNSVDDLFPITTNLLNKSDVAVQGNKTNEEILLTAEVNSDEFSSEKNKNLQNKSEEAEQSDKTSEEILPDVLTDEFCTKTLEDSPNQSCTEQSSKTSGQISEVNSDEFSGEYSPNKSDVSVQSNKTNEEILLTTEVNSDEFCSEKNDTSEETEQSEKTSEEILPEVNSDIFSGKYSLNKSDEAQKNNKTNYELQYNSDEAEQYNQTREEILPNANSDEFCAEINENDSLTKTKISENTLDNQQTRTSSECVKTQTSTNISGKANLHNSISISGLISENLLVKTDSKINDPLFDEIKKSSEIVADIKTPISYSIKDQISEGNVEIDYKEIISNNKSVIQTFDNDDTEAPSDEDWNKSSDNIGEENHSKTPSEADYTHEYDESNSNIAEHSVLLSYGFIDIKKSPDNSLNTSTSIDENVTNTTEKSLALHEKTAENTSSDNKMMEELKTANVVETPEDEHISNEKELSSPNSQIDKTKEISKSTPEETKSPSNKKTVNIDVKKRVSEILADANIQSPRDDKSPRLQDLYITAYDVVSPDNSSLSGSPTDEIELNFTPRVFGNDEVEELLKKQLQIEQEIKEIQQQQQKEHIPYVYVREIPNKPPPPYTPPVATQSPISGSILPANEKQVRTVTRASAKIIHDAYINGNLQNVALSIKDFKSFLNKFNIEQNCVEFVFDLCKEAAIDYYKQFETETGPSWKHLVKKTKLAIGRPCDESGLEKLFDAKIKQWLGYENTKYETNTKSKWSGKKRDHVDDLLVVECQADESEWTNYDRDELIVKDELTKDITNMLLDETVQVLNRILIKKSHLY